MTWNLRRQGGLTLVELMVALTLGLLLSGMIVGIFVSNHQSYRIQNALARIQESGRFGLEFMGRDIRGASFLGSCQPAGDIHRVTNTLSSGYFANVAVGVEGFDAGGTDDWEPALDSSISDESPTDGSDILTLRLAGDGVPVETPYMDDPSAAIQVQADDRFKQGNIAVVCDASAAAIFQITSISSGSLVHGKNLGKKFGAGAEIFTFSTKSYFVATSQSGSGTSLWVKVDDADPVELVEDVERMQIEYGLSPGNEDQSADRYVAAPDVDDWARVVAVRLHLLIASGEPGLRSDGAQSMTFNDNDKDTPPLPSSTRIRKTFTSVINLRNRVP
ncbi:MAG: PilW family protein [Rhodocyclaceae bacterium]|jgi:type IV pilus assembly protein PilW|nr:PilW family protein [Rhodocyclaceae bacterium]